MTAPTADQLQEFYDMIEHFTPSIVEMFLDKTELNHPSLIDYYMSTDSNMAYILGVWREWIAKRNTI